MRAVFGIDVSKASSEVAILVNGEKVHGYTMPNDTIGFTRLLGDLKTVHKPEIIFEATGIYSRRLQAFLEDNGYVYTRLNPLCSLLIKRENRYYSGFWICYRLFASIFSFLFLFTINYFP